MEYFRIVGEQPLQGRVSISGAKNAVLPEIAATLLTEEPCILTNAPYLSDVGSMLSAAAVIGAHYDVNANDYTIRLTTEKIYRNEINYELAGRLRASFLLAGPLLGRDGYAKISMPGGCAIGNRPVDLHLKGLEALGAEISTEWGYVEACAPKGLRGAELYLDFPSVGATENLLMAACLAEGRTTIHNAAAEPEILDLTGMLRKMGAQIDGEGTNTLTIQGVTKLRGVSHRVMPDRIEAGTFMAAVAAAGGDVRLLDVAPGFLQPVSAKMREAGIVIHETSDSVRVISGERHLYPVDIKTLPHPGFPTDMQAQMTALLTLASGTSIVTETIFNHRFNHINELGRMGAHIQVEGPVAIVEGNTKLTGTGVTACDLRAGAALVVAALAAHGETTIKDVHHINRGYFDLTGKLSALGASVSLERR